MNFSQFKQKFEKVKVIEIPNTVNQPPKVSVLVQTFQHVNHIEKCLTSILSQKTNFNFEILVGDDASIDGTREICMDLAIKHPEKIRLFFHHRENNIKIDGNPTGRFNFLYNFYSSNGEFISICEGDDYWTDDLKLQKQVDFLINNQEYLLVSSGFISKNLKLEKEQIMILQADDASNNSLEGFDIDLEVFYKYWAVKTLTLMVRKEAIDINVFFRFYYASDIHLNYYLLKKGKGYYMKQIFGVYNITGNGVATSKSINEMLSKKTATYNELYKIHRDPRHRVISYYSTHKLLKNNIVNKEINILARIKESYKLFKLIRKFSELRSFFSILPLVSILTKNRV